MSEWQKEALHGLYRRLKVYNEFLRRMNIHLPWFDFCVPHTSPSYLDYYHSQAGNSSVMISYAMNNAYASVSRPLPIRYFGVSYTHIG